MAYRKSQTGWLMICLILPVILFLTLAYVNQWGNNPIPLLPYIGLTVFLVIICIIFYKLIIQIDGPTLKVIYGMGLIRLNFHIDELKQTEIIKTPWYYGLGIRLTPKGMLYNIQGPMAIKVAYLRKGKQKSVMIGTPEPERLKKALDLHFAQ